MDNCSFNIKSRTDGTFQYQVENAPGAQSGYNNSAGTSQLLLAGLIITNKAISANGVTNLWLYLWNPTNGFSIVQSIGFTNSTIAKSDIDLFRGDSHTNYNDQTINIFGRIMVGLNGRATWFPAGLPR